MGDNVSEVLPFSHAFERLELLHAIQMKCYSYLIRSKVVMDSTT